MVVDEPARSAEPLPETREQAALASDGSLPLGTVIADRYELVALVGAGGQGEVWRARDVVISGHVVALKMFYDRAKSDEEREQQLRELRMLASVSHPSVVQFKDHGWFGGRLWFVMPWYEGQDLERALPLDRAEARRIFEQVAAGLAAVHAKGLRHQDLKPSNIFLAKIAGLEGTLPILLDFGVAAAEDEILVAGSPAFFAPELAKSWPTPSPEVGPAADVFSLALSLRIALDPSGVPEVSAYDRASLDRRAEEPITPPSGPGLAYLAPAFRRWLALDPEARPSAADFGKELAILTAPEDRRRERARLARRVAPWAILTLVLAVLGGAWARQRIADAERESARQEKERLAAELREREQSERASQLDSALDEARARADASSEEMSAALGRLDEAQRAIASAAGDAARLRVAGERLQSALAEARAHAERQQAALDESAATITRISAELGDTRRGLDATRAERDRLTAERDGLRRELEGARADVAARAAELERVRADLTHQRDAAESARQAAESARRAAEADRDAARSAAAMAEAEASRLRAQLASATRGSSASGGSSAGSSEAPPSTPPEEPASAATSPGASARRGRRGSGAQVSGATTVTSGDGTTP